MVLDIQTQGPPELRKGANWYIVNSEKLTSGQQRPFVKQKFPPGQPSGNMVKNAKLDGSSVRKMFHRSSYAQALHVE